MFYQFGFLVFKKPFFERCLCFLSRESKFYFVHQCSEPQVLSDRCPGLCLEHFKAIYLLDFLFYVSECFVCTCLNCVYA